MLEVFFLVSIVTLMVLAGVFYAGLDRLNQEVIKLRQQSLVFCDILANINDQQRSLIKLMGKLKEEQDRNSYKIN